MTMQDHHSEPSPRREPSLGRFDELQFSQPRSDAPRASRIGAVTERLRAWDWRWIVAVIAFVFALLLVLRQPLANWLWPETRAERLRHEAGRALAAGRLTADDGSGARELYAAALALDPDRADARAGLDRVGQAALVQARAAIARRQFARAHEALQLADDLSVPRAQANALREQLRRNEAGSVGIDQLLQQAAAARAAGKLEGGDGALPLYQRVLELQPDRTQALEGREDTLSDLLQQARDGLVAGDLAAATVIVRRVQAADAGHVELPDALAALARAGETRRRQADRQLRDGQLEQALEGYGAALLVDPEDAEALRGVRAVASAHAQRSDHFSADYRFDEAEAELQQARSVMGDSAAQVPAIAEAEQHLTRARQSQRQVATRAPTQAQRRQLTQLLAEAAQAQARGDLITPPGDSAFDKLRAAGAIAPQDRRVLAASARLAPAATECFNDALRGNRLVRAGECLDARRALEGENAAVRAGRRELARRWIAMGDQRLSSGEVKGAQAALETARALDPAAEGLAVFADRLRMATMATDAEGEQP
jgi:tetratricopeptide (TPR) repeat protein